MKSRLLRTAGCIALAAGLTGPSLTTQARADVPAALASHVSARGVVSVIDTSTNAILSTHSIGTFSDLEVGPDGTTLYGTAAGTVVVIDTAKLAPTMRVNFGFANSRA